MPLPDEAGNGLENQIEALEAAKGTTSTAHWVKTQMPELQKELAHAKKFNPERAEKAYKKKSSRKRKR